MTLLDILFPKRCFSCHRLGSYLCASCRKYVSVLDHLNCPVCKKPAVDGITHPRCKTRYTPDGLISFFRYKSPIREYIHAIKYRYLFHAADELVEMCCVTPHMKALQMIIRKIRDHVVLVPMPLHKKRLMERGFNQSECIAQCISQRLHIPMMHDILLRTTYTPPQALMPRASDRINNMRNVFEVNETKKQAAMGKTVLLVDDVWTTGATLMAATRILKHSGAAKVFGLTVAQS